MISVLLDKGYAYIAGGNVYFDTSKLDNLLCFRQYERGGPCGRRARQRGGGRQQAQQSGLCALVYKVKV